MVLIGLSISSIFIGPASQAQSNTTQPCSLRVFSYNIYHGETMKGDFDLDLIAEVIRNTDADLVALQEVDFRTRRARGYDLATELAHRAGYLPLFAKAMDFDGGAYGEAILSKYPVIASRKVDLPHSSANEPRTALEITTEICSGDTIQFIGTHLDHTRDPRDRVRQCQALNQSFVSNAYPTILAGDLNATPESEAMKILFAHWTPADGAKFDPTIPTKSPKRKIDYILYLPRDRWEVLETETICDTIASDHCGLLATLLLPAEDSK